MSDQKIRLGVVGCGGFGLFALQHFTQVRGVELVGMAGTHRPAAVAAARRFGVADVEEVAVRLAIVCRQVHIRLLLKAALIMNPSRHR
jgi:predicted homoserine dehydrogenase-like protein